MKKHFVFLLALLISISAVNAQSEKGFDYKAHKSMNKRAAAWGKRRTKASKRDMTNIGCSVKQTRRATRRGRK